MGPQFPAGRRRAARGRALAAAGSALLAAEDADAIRRVAGAATAELLGLDQGGEPALTGEEVTEQNRRPAVLRARAGT